MTYSRDQIIEKGVLLLSDFHYVDVDLEDSFESKIQDASFGNNLITAVKKNSLSVKGEDRFQIEYIIVLGDIAYNGSKSEYENATLFLEKLCKDLCVKKENVLIIPGNHDVNRSALKTKISLEKSKSPDFSKYQKDKFVDFAEFYDSFYKETSEEIVFDADKVIMRKLYAYDIETLFIGINTNYKESHLTKEQYGFIDYAKLDTELRQLNKEIKKDKIQRVIALMHHRPASFESSNILDNWDQIISCFRDNGNYKITTFFFGGYTTTTKGMKVTTKNTLNLLVSGSLNPTTTSSASPAQSFMMLKYVKNEELSLFKVYPFNYETSGNEKYWQIQTNDPGINDSIVFETISGPEALDKQLNDKGVSLPGEGNIVVNKGESQAEGKDTYLLDPAEIKELESKFNNAESFVLNVIKDNNLYLLGDFRWDPEGRSISYILMDYFFDNCQSYKVIKRCYQLLLNTYGDNWLARKMRLFAADISIIPDLDTGIREKLNIKEEDIVKNELNPKQVIGFEMNGSIIGSFLAISNNYDFTYIPADTRNHSDYENKLPNNTEKYKHLIVVIDLIYTQALLDKLIKRIKKNYPNVLLIQFISLIEGVKNDLNCKKKKKPIPRIITNKSFYLTEDKKTLVLANSVCKIPMVSDYLNLINQKFLNKEIIPVYQLYSSTKQGVSRYSE